MVNIIEVLNKHSFSIIYQTKSSTYMYIHSKLCQRVCHSWGFNKFYKETGCTWITLGLQYLFTYCEKLCSGEGLIPKAHTTLSNQLDKLNTRHIWLAFIFVVGDCAAKSLFWLDLLQDIRWKLPKDSGLKLLNFLNWYI